jgi:hypothetical protein
MRRQPSRRGSEEEALQKAWRSRVVRSSPANIERDKYEKRPERECPYLDKSWCRRDRALCAIDLLRGVVGCTSARDPEQDEADDGKQDENQKRHPQSHPLKRHHARRVAALLSWRHGLSRRANSGRLRSERPLFPVAVLLCAGRARVEHVALLRVDRVPRPGGQESERLLTPANRAGHEQSHYRSSPRTLRAASSRPSRSPSRSRPRR